MIPPPAASGLKFVPSRIIQNCSFRTVAHARQASCFSGIQAEFFWLLATDC